MLLTLLTPLALLFLQAPSGAPRATEADFVIPNFRFTSGETLPQLKMHYRTWGTPKKDAQGIVRNAVLVMHGTGGTGAQFAGRGVRRRAVRAGAAARRHAVLHHPAGRHRPRPIEQAERRTAREVPALRLPRHGRAPSIAW